MKNNEVVMFESGKGKNTGTIIITTIVLPSKEDATKFVKAITGQDIKETAGVTKEEKNTSSA